MLDAVCGDITATSSKLAGPEKAKLDQVLDSCRVLERQIAKRIESTSMGLQPTAPPATLDRSGLTAEVVRGHADVIVNAFAFGITHVAHLSILGYNDFNDSWSSFGIPGDAHQNYSHLGITGWTGEMYDAALLKITQWKAGELAYIFGKPREFPEAGATVADGALAMWLNSGGGKHHTGGGYHAAVLVGNAGVALKSGQYLELPVKTRSIADIYTTVAQAVGAKIDKFGDPTINKGPFAELLA